MLQRLIHSARVNVFESARFYYWMLVVLTSYFLVNRFLQKLSYLYLDGRWTELKIGEGVLFGLAYGFILISAWSLRKKIPPYVLGCWGGGVVLGWGALLWAAPACHMLTPEPVTCYPLSLSHHLSRSES